MRSIPRQPGGRRRVPRDAQVIQTAADFSRRRAPLPSILIVDGDPDTRMLYRTLFTGVAGTIFEAEDGAEAALLTGK